VKPQPYYVRELHKAIAVCAASGMLSEAKQYWERAPVRYRAAMSLCMYLGRFRSRSKRNQVNAHARDQDSWVATPTV
jgi:hypothetical protein